MSVLSVLVGLFMVAVPAFAHHGNASYDYEKTITVKATVTSWLWSNLHCLLRFDVKDEKGDVQHWVTEASSPVDMLRIGWSNSALKLGDEITIDDPKFYTKPWVAANKLTLHLLPADFDMGEMICSPQEMEEYKRQVANPISDGSK